MEGDKPAPNWLLGLIAISPALPEAFRPECLEMRVSDWRNADEGLLYTVEVQDHRENGRTWFKTMMSVEEVLAIFPIIKHMVFRGKKAHIKSLLDEYEKDLEYNDWDEVGYVQVTVKDSVKHAAFPAGFVPRESDPYQGHAFERLKQDIAEAMSRFVGSEELGQRKRVRASPDEDMEG